ncbi:inositol polyphosphate 1-phosphatase-like [Musca vetustissima]|uniref:inositol polyphosphate 1-phosphatase-like n=1 Tax=Musca vetustissima TaxID=27455 RepID=UPI002AB68B5E|nr:inositol polyphosphate 1-phosphatase-like [Musca vetustissima]
MTTTDNHNLLRSLINAAEKAANIARICRSNQQLLSLLVREKTGDEANARFEHDFKTLADVLIQEAIKYDVGNEFPEMKDNIRGEESPNFTNANGENIAIVVGPTATETEACLLAILQEEHQEAAKILAEEVHRQVTFDKELNEEIPELPNDVDYSQLGVWIDPIDATAEYISGDTMFTNFPGITSTGLDCVTVLIGVYDTTTGVPVIGVICQPFRNKLQENVYTSAMFWGIALPNLQVHCNALTNSSSDRGRLLGIFSSSERAELLQQMLELGYEFAFSAGAGHKALKVITNEVDAYVLSKGSTFKWDTCAPQAILRSLNGDIIEFQTSIREGKPIPLKYIPNEKESENAEEETTVDWKCNRHGLIAVRDIKLFDDLLQKLANS